MRVYLNGRYLNEEQACIGVDDRGFLYGDALYESVRIFRGGFFRFREHWERLTRGASALKIAGPSYDELRRIAGMLAVENSISDGIVRVTLTRGPGGAGLRTLNSGPPTLLVTVRPVSAERLARAAEGLTAIVARARRSPVGLPSSIKSANRLDAILARLEADEAGVDEAVMLSSEGYVAEGTVSNIFWMRGARLCTPELGIGILPGVTRMALVELCESLGIELEEGRWKADDLRAAREIFLTMSSTGPARLRELDGEPIPLLQDGLYARLREAYWSLVVAEATADRAVAD